MFLKSGLNHIFLLAEVYLEQQLGNVTMGPIIISYVGKRESISPSPTTLNELESLRVYG